MNDAVKEKLLASRAVAKERVPMIKLAKAETELHAHLHAYICAKYLLEDCEEDDIDELTDASIAQTFKLDKSLMREVDIAAECTGSTSAMRKKTLLIMAIQKELGIELDPELTSKAKTVGDLAALIYAEINGCA